MAADPVLGFPEAPEPRHAYYLQLLEGGAAIDDVVFVYYRAPQSYTGEDMGEIFCHGNPIIVQKIIRLLNRRGVRLAEPGEFTKRAFLNGKVDLTEAEAVNHIIMAKSEWEIETSLRQMHGSLRQLISAVRNRIIDLKADIEAEIDFSDEELEGIGTEKSLESAQWIRESLENMLSKCRTGEQLSHGIDITITGKPNVGKSSILNLLLNRERAIVTDIPGTTRDIIREPFQISGMHVNLNDTAGIDIPGDEIEKIGMDLSHQKIETSPFVIVVCDAVSGITAADRSILGKTGRKKRIILINKTDIARREDIERAGTEVGEEAIEFSAKTGSGLEKLKEAIARRIKNEYADIEHTFIADLRIISLLEDAVETTGRIRNLIVRRDPGEIIAFELQALMDILSGITGEITPDDILDSIFSRFCIGK